MRILQVINSSNPAGGGPIEAIVQAHRTLAPMGHETEMVCLDSPNDEWVDRLGLPNHALGPTVSPYRYCARLKPWMMENAPRFDCAIVHGIWLYPSYATWKTFKQLSLPFFVYTHGMLDPNHKRVFPGRHLKKKIIWNLCERRILQEASGVFFTVPEELTLARELFDPLPCEDTARIVPYCIGEPPHAPERQKTAFFETFPQVQSTRNWLFLSRVHPKKGIDLLIEAFAEVCKGDDNLRLIIAGNGPKDYRRSLEQQAENLGVTDRIVWTGMIEGDLKWGAFHASELFILPSHQENYGIAVVEALATGKPVVISNHINIWERIRDAGGGLICTDTADSTREQLVRWENCSEAEKQTFSEAAKRCFQQDFSAQVAADNLLKVLGEAGVQDNMVRV